MGFLGRISQWVNTTGAKAWNSVKQGAATGYNMVHGIAHKIGSVADGIDQALTNIKGVPIVGQLATALQTNPLYQEVKQGIKTGVDVVDKAGQIGREVGGAVDKVLEGAKMQT